MVTATKTRSKSIRVLALGGGTGLSMLLRGLKEYCARLYEGPRSRPSIQIDAVVTVTDDGGSSGRLRREYSILPPGDIRNCMVALSPDEALLSKLFQYRFPGPRSGLGGHSFGNLFLAALTHITGDFPEAVRLSSNVLATRGRIFPSTAKNVALRATLDSGRIVVGETKISRSPRRIRRVELVPAARPLPEAIRAIHDADLILVGPGSLYTSIIPNLLVQGVASAIGKSRAKRVYIANLMTQPGETTGYSVADHVRAIYQHAGNGLFDSIVLNTGAAPARVLRRYCKEGAEPIDPSLHELDAMGVQHVASNLLQRGDVIRHDQRRLAKLILDHYVYETRS
ncbi:MAG TPA: gluconeogenesis factor YvcK family protein [Candidatus Acidoferrales bacterium]|nr:gluconeogenesis factor YvcK family protein [Candidatus Acidoferrales bacterium]